MKNMSIYEPAMCCSTGLCGVGVDPELLRISTGINALNKHGIKVERYNLTSAPMEFVTNTAINQLVNEKGIDELPAIVLDDKIVISGRYPSNEEIAKMLDVPVAFLTEEQKTAKVTPKKVGGCSCKGGQC
jgi:hypothetical protein